MQNGHGLCATRLKYRLAQSLLQWGMEDCSSLGPTASAACVGSSLWFLFFTSHSWALALTGIRCWFLLALVLFPFCPRCSSRCVCFCSPAKLTGGGDQPSWRISCVSIVLKETRALIGSLRWHFRFCSTNLRSAVLTVSLLLLASVYMLQPRLHVVDRCRRGG